jgi:hypothetical protein
MHPIVVPPPDPALAPSRRSRLRFPILLVALVAAGLQLLQACSFSAPEGALQTPQDMYAVLDAAPYADDATVTGDRWRVIDDAKLKVDHGFRCAGAPRAAGKEYIGVRVFDQATLPTGFDGTVYLNGWYLEYAKSDHHVLGLGSVIFNIAQNGTELTWDAGGVLSDHKADDAFSWCYRYTVVQWARRPNLPIGGLPKPYVDVQASHANATGKLVFVDQSLGGDNFHTRTARFKTQARPRARLFNGFGVTFDDDDHHLLQFGFDLGTPRLKRKRITWTSDVILKDNSDRTYRAGQLATVLTGESVTQWKPETVLMESGRPEAPGFLVNDLELTPADDASACLFNEDSTREYRFRIDNVPYTWAMPMLTGWDLGTPCDDEHVKKIGAWIDDFQWVRNPGDSAGTLTYSVKTIVADKSPDSGLVDGFKVEVLGIDIIEPPGNAP